MKKTPAQVLSESKKSVSKILEDDNNLLKEVPKGPEYGGDRYAYSIGADIPMYKYKHSLGDLILIGPQPNEGFDGWQISFFLEEGGEWQTLDESGVEEEEIVGHVSTIAYDISKLNTQEELNTYFQNNEFESI